MTGTLTPKQALFVAEFLVDMNATQAAIRAGYSAKTANEQGARLLANVSIASAIEDARARRIERLEITQDMVLKRWWMLATADPNELTQLHRNCCRFCYGKDHNYQWRDAAEYRAAVLMAEESAPSGDDAPPPRLPTNEGGYGFDPKLSPHAKCPKCDGDGVVDIYFADTRNLSDAGKLLFAGVKTTQHGIEIKMNDRMAAMESVAKHLGMYKTHVELTGKKALDDALASLDDDD